MAHRRTEVMPGITEKLTDIITEMTEKKDFLTKIWNDWND